jgi:hypothetical protein
MHNAVKIPLYLYVLYYLNTELKIRDFVNFYYSQAEVGGGGGGGGRGGWMRQLYVHRAQERSPHLCNVSMVRHLVRPLVTE